MSMPTGTPSEAMFTLASLMGLGYAGLDSYDDTRFVVDAPEPFQTDGEKACDVLGAYFLRTDPLGVPSSHVACLLPQRVRDMLGLDEPGAPTLIVPLASRRVDDGLNRLIDDVAGRAVAS